MMQSNIRGCCFKFSEDSVGVLRGKVILYESGQHLDSTPHV